MTEVECTTAVNTSIHCLNSENESSQVSPALLSSFLPPHLSTMARRFLAALIACIGFAQMALASDEAPPVPASDTAEPDLSPRFLFTLDTLAYPIYIAIDQASRAKPN